jgi:hypothetical protein
MDQPSWLLDELSLHSSSFLMVAWQIWLGKLAPDLDRAGSQRYPAVSLGSNAGAGDRLMSVKSSLNWFGGSAVVRSVMITIAMMAISGCATFWDDVTSREFKFNEMFQPPQPPLQVLESTQDGDKRARALSRLKEPLRHGGSQSDQDVVAKVLVDSSASERQALCRIRAIESMREFKDPRVVEGLKEAYYRAGSFSPEMASIVRIQALDALGYGGHQEGLDLLLKVAGDKMGEVFLGAQMQELGSVGPATLDLIDREVEATMREASRLARLVLETNWNAVLEAADALIEHETLSGVALEAILAPTKPVQVGPARNRGDEDQGSDRPYSGAHPSD